ncbi:MAG: hypothetical protein HeimAB125_18650 [Candidatus Heimdallarchaeota archaeon AB_125]|nr:MAG: hypothetical protein HeimAB125_18650 [Candidatus Heimdallarchaeota archaeon AB_125]
MKHIKQLTFNITQSRRIKNYSQKNNIPEKELLAKYRVIMDIVYSAWMKNREINPDLQFRTFFLNIMKYAEFAFRLDVRKEDLVKITEHVEILEGAIEEYNQDYAKLIKIEEVVKDYEGRNVE